MFAISVSICRDYAPHVERVDFNTFHTLFFGKKCARGFYNFCSELYVLKIHTFFIFFGGIKLHLSIENNNYYLNLLGAYSHIYIWSIWRTEVFGCFFGGVLTVFGDRGYFLFSYKTFFSFHSPLSPFPSSIPHFSSHSLHFFFNFSTSHKMAKYALLAALFVSVECHGSQQYVRDNSKALWESFKRDHGKRYTSIAAEDERFEVFVANLERAVDLQGEQQLGATFGVNRFTDMTQEEFKAYHSLSIPTHPSPDNVFSPADLLTLKAEIDWRHHSAVTHIKDQGQCGSCWAFSTVGGIEGQYSLAGNSLTSLSEQQLVSCDTIDKGCAGGLMDNALKWLLANTKGEIATEASYPYTSGEGSVAQCVNTTTVVGARIQTYRDLPHTETQMQAFVSTYGPLSIAVDAQKWQSYNSGIMTNCCASTGCSLDHGVVIVGYGSNYWIVKNSWGVSWGESGYIRLAMGNNECGLNQAPTTSVV